VHRVSDPGLLIQVEPGAEQVLDGNDPGPGVVLGGMRDAPARSRRFMVDWLTPAMAAARLS